MLKSIAAFSSILVVAAATAASAQPNTLPVDASAMPSPALSGYGEIYGADYLVTSDDDSNWAWGIGGAGRINVPFDDRWNMQTDLTVDHTSADESSITGLGGAAHFYWRDPMSHAVGIYTQMSHLMAEDDDGDQTEAELVTFGAEGQIYWNNITLYGQGYYRTIDAGGDHGDSIGARGVVRFFATSNLRLDGEVSYSWIGSGGDGVDVVGGAAQASYRFMNSPVSIFGRYSIDHISPDDGSGGFAHTFMAGLRTTFGPRTAIEEDRYGPTMDTGRGLLSLY